jgi:hypothetical protein
VAGGVSAATDAPFPVRPAEPMVRVEFNKEREMVRAEHIA